MLAACGTLLVAGLFAWTHAGANDRTGPPAASPMLVDPKIASADLERIFWQCDYAASTVGVGLEEGAYCSAIHEEMKNRKFAGDFGAMLAWWQQNKSSEYAALAARSRAVKLR